MVTGTLFCPHCGEKITLTDEFETKFCPYCGKDITPALDSAAAAPAQAAVHAAPQAAPAEDARTAETQVRPAPADSRAGKGWCAQLSVGTADFCGERGLIREHGEEKFLINGQGLALEGLDLYKVIN